MKNANVCFKVATPNSINLEKWQKTVDLMSELYDSACGVIVQIRNDEFSVVRTSKNESNFLTEDSTWAWEMKSFCRKVVESKQALYINDTVKSSKWKGAPAVCAGPVRSYFGLPILWPDGNVFGTICLIDTKSSNYNLTFRDLLDQLRDLIGADLRHVVDMRNLEKAAITDELTGLYNLRGLCDLGQQRISDAHRFNLSLALIYIDIDNLKVINDEYGHKQGDECIVTLARMMKINFRKNDVVARVGGDEFLVITLNKGSSYQELEYTCERLTNDFVEQFPKVDRGHKLSISFGVKFFKDDQKCDLMNMIDEVDKIMYEAKRNESKVFGEA